jgi:anti-sigma-K factor RskA
MSAGPHDDLRWSELAAGFALHALEPDEEQTFREHLADCTTCQATLDEHSLVAAQLASLVDDTTMTAPPWSRIRPALDLRPSTVPMQRPQQPAAEPREAVVRHIGARHARVLAAAAAFVGLVGVAVAGWQLTNRSNNETRVPSAIAACRATAGCHVVRLLADGKVEAGDVVVRDGSAAVVPTAMPALDAAHVYVLWQVPRDGRPTPVTALGAVRTAQASPSTTLKIPYADTVAFAMSVEPADRVPTKPTNVVAVGTAA